MKNIRKTVALLTALSMLGTLSVSISADEIGSNLTIQNVISESEVSDVWDGSADTSWYNDTDTEFTLTTAEQLSGLAKLVNEGNNFEGKTINLGSDIVLNNGEFSKSSDGVYQYNGVDIPEDEMQNYWTNDTYYEKNTYMKYLTDSTTSVYENMPKVWTTIGCDANNFFAGTFNGNNHTVSGLYQNSLFGFVGHTDYPEGSLALTSEDLSNSDYVGNISNVGVVNGLLSTPAIAYKLCGTLTNCYNTNDIYNPYISLSFIGGLVGENCGSIYDCYNTGNIDTSSAFNGGINGVSYSNTIVDNCYNTGNISGKINQPIEILNDFLVVTANGGITGYASHDNIITNCTNSGEIFTRNDYLSDDNSGNKSSTFYDYSFNNPCAGGIVGACGGNNITQKGLNIIANCCNNENVTADALENNNSSAWSGGIVGIGSYCAIDSCYNTGNVSAMSNIRNITSGGIISYGGFITNSYNTGSISAYTEQSGEDCPTTYVGGITGYDGALKNCYNVGEVSTNATSEKTYLGGVSGRYGVNRGISKIDFKNLYYLDTTYSTSVSNPDKWNVDGSTFDTMTSQEFATSLGDAFTYVEGNYPSLVAKDVNINNIVANVNTYYENNDDISGEIIDRNGDGKITSSDLYIDEEDLQEYVELSQKTCGYPWLRARGIVLFDEVTDSTEIFAYEDGSLMDSDGCFYYVIQDGEAWITGYTNEIQGLETVVVPNEIDGYPVTAITQHAFINTPIISSMKYLVLPNSLKVIDNNSTQTSLYSAYNGTHTFEAASTNSLSVIMVVPDTNDYKEKLDALINKYNNTNNSVIISQDANNILISSTNDAIFTSKNLIFTHDSFNYDMNNDGSVNAFDLLLLKKLLLGLKDTTDFPVAEDITSNLNTSDFFKLKKYLLGL